MATLREGLRAVVLRSLQPFRRDCAVFVSDGSPIILGDPGLSFVSSLLGPLSHVQVFLCSSRFCHVVPYSAERRKAGFPAKLRMEQINRAMTLRMTGGR